MGKKRKSVSKAEQEAVLQEVKTTGEVEKKEEVKVETRWSKKVTPKKETPKKKKAKKVASEETVVAAVDASGDAKVAEASTSATKKKKKRRGGSMGQLEIEKSLGNTPNKEFAVPEFAVSDWGAPATPEPA